MLIKICSEQILDIMEDQVKHVLEQYIKLAPDLRSFESCLASNSVLG